MSDNDGQAGGMMGRGCAANRMADAMLRTAGGSQVTLRVANPASGDTSSQIGLEAPAAADVEIGPAEVRDLRPDADGKRRIEVTVGANALRPVVKQCGILDVAAWLLASEGVVHRGQLMAIETVVVDRFVGTDCLYHLTATE